MYHARKCSRKDREAGYSLFFGGLKGLTLHGFLALCMTCGLNSIDAGDPICYLLLPLALGISVLSGLVFRIGGVIATAVLLFVLLLILGFGDFGLFGSMSSLQGVLFASALWFMNVLFALVAALAVGYQRRLVEVATHRANMLYKVFDSLPIGIWVRSRAGQSLFVNERWAGFSEKSVDEILASPGAEAPVDLGDDWQREVEDVLKSDDGAVRYRSINLKDGLERDCSLTLLTLRMFIDQEGDFGTLSLLVDETALRLYEEKVRASEHNLHLALNNADMGFWDEDFDAEHPRCDENWYRLLGLSAESEGSPLDIWNARLHPDDRERVQGLYGDYYESGSGSFRIDYRVRHESGNYVWMQDSVRITEYRDNGSPQRVMGTMQDISEMKLVELELKHARDRAEAANEAKSHFIATISHEIRTPLNAIIGLSSFLTESELDEESLDLAQTIHSSGKSLLLLVNDILDFSKIEAGRLDLEVQEFPLQLCFEESVKLFKVRAAEKNVDLSLSVAEDLPEFAVGDMERLRQIIQNLLANALKFTDVGEVEVSVHCPELSSIPEVYRPDPFEPIGYLDQSDHEYLQVSIRDSGIGIPEDRQHLLFEAFSQVDATATRKHGGTGLGLVICKRLVDAMGGRIWVESREGEGATFSFVVRTKLLREELDLSRLTRTPFEQIERIAGKYPCDILIVASEAKAEAMLLCCRKLGYSPHVTDCYDFNGNIFRRRQYNAVFIWIDDERSTLELIRKLSSSINRLRPDSVVGFANAEQKLSMERCRLSGMSELFEGKIRPDSMSQLILRLLLESD